MRKLVCAFGLAACLATAAGAITYGVPDGDAHPNVGLLVGKTAEGYFAICSGTLVSPTVFLTAGHCTAALEDLNAEAFVTFEPDPPYLGTLLSGTAHTHPGWTTSFTDVGVVVLDQPVTGIVPARIPSEGYLDELSTRRGQRDVYFTHIGYGTQSVKPIATSNVVRYQGVSALINLRNAVTGGVNLQTTANPGGGKSGICFGDSGGPAFFTNTDIVVGIHSFVLNSNCKGSAVSYRVDTAETLDFLAEFGVFPSF